MDITISDIIFIICLVIVIPLISHYCYRIITLKNRTFSFDHIEKRNEENHVGVLTFILAYLIYWAIMMSGVYLIAILFDLKTSALVAFVTSIAFTIGLGVQGMLGDFVAGIVIAIMGMYRIGDVIEISEISGTVVDFHLLHTIIRDSQTNAYVTIPNNIIQTSMTKNHTLTNYKKMFIDVIVRNDIKSGVDMIEDLIKKDVDENPHLYEDVDFNRESEHGYVYCAPVSFQHNGTTLRIYFEVNGKSSRFDTKYRLHNRVYLLLTKMNVLANIG